MNADALAVRLRNVTSWSARSVVEEINGCFVTRAVVTEAVVARSLMSTVNVRVDPLPDTVIPPPATFNVVIHPLQRR